MVEIKPLFMGYFTFTADMREVVNACFYLEHTGCQWRALPTNFGPHQTVRTWYDRFRTEGVWAQAAADLTRRVREAHGHGAEPTTGILDSQSVVSGPQKGERGVDGNKKIKGIKRHILTCSLGFVLAVLATPANVHDTQAAGPLLDRAAQHGWAPKRVKVMGSTSVSAWTPPRRVMISTCSSPPAHRRRRGSRRCPYAGASREPLGRRPTTIVV